MESLYKMIFEKCHKAQLMKIIEVLSIKISELSGTCPNEVNDWPCGNHQLSCPTTSELEEDNHLAWECWAIWGIDTIGRK